MVRCVLLLALVGCAATPTPAPAPRPLYSADEQLILNGYLPPITPAIDAAVVLGTAMGKPDEGKEQLDVLCNRGDQEACLQAGWLTLGPREATEGLADAIEQTWSKADQRLRYCGGNWDAYGEVKISALIDPHGDTLGISATADTTVPEEVVKCITQQARMISHGKHDEKLGLLSHTHTVVFSRRVTKASLPESTIRSVSAYLFAADPTEVRLGRVALNKACDGGDKEACSLVGWLERWNHDNPPKPMAVGELVIDQRDIDQQRFEFRRCGKWVQQSSYTLVDVYLDPHGHVVATRTEKEDSHARSASRCFTQLFRSFTFPAHAYGEGIVHVLMPVAVDVNDSPNSGYSL